MVVKFLLEINGSYWLQCICTFSKPINKLNNHQKNNIRSNPGIFYIFVCTYVYICVFISVYIHFSNIKIKVLKSAFSPFWVIKFSYPPKVDTDTFTFFFCFLFFVPTFEMTQNLFVPSFKCRGSSLSLCLLNPKKVLP